MIEARGARDNGQADAPAADRFKPREETASRLPLYIALAVTAVAGYLRLALPDLRWPGARASEAKAEEPTAAAVAEAPGALRGTTPPAAPPDVADEPEALEDEAPAPRQSSNVILFPTHPYRLIDSPPITYEPLDAPPRAAVGDLQSVEFAAPSALPGAPGSGAGSPPAEAGAEESARRNRAPETGPTIRLNEAVAGSVLLIGLDELLAHAKDADGDTLTIRSIRVSEGSIARTEGGFVYSSNAAALPDNVVVIYEVSDGTANTLQTAIIPLVRGPIRGTEGADILLGTNLGDQIEGGAGSDLIDAREGNDVIFGGAGDDQIVAGAGDDIVFAGAGSDTVFGGAGNDVLWGEAGNDRLMGEEGADTLMGGTGDDLLDGGADDDLLDGGEGNDTLHGGDGRDVLLGGAGDDVIHDGVGSDQVIAGPGDDLVVAALDAADDVYEGGEGDDTLDFSDATVDLDIDLVGETITSAETGVDQVSGFENVIGGNGNDTFRIGGEAMRLTGGDGSDTFRFELPTLIDRPTLIHDILDFVVGDRISVAAFEFTMEEEDDREDQFERYYRDRDDDDATLELRIRHRHDESHGEITVLEFDADGDFEFEMTVEVLGRYQPFVYETITA